MNLVLGETSTNETRRVDENGVKTFHQVTNPPNSYYEELWKQDLC